MPDIIVTLKSYLVTLQETHDNVPTQKELAKSIQLSENNFSLIVNNKKAYPFTRKQLALLIARLRQIDEGCNVGDLLRFVE